MHALLGHSPSAAAWLEAADRDSEGISPHVKTPDAIHLASALGIGRDPLVITHDATWMPSP